MVETNSGEFVSVPCMSFRSIPLTVLLSICAIVLGVSPGGCTNPQLQDYAGNWLLKSHGKDMMLLTIRAHGHTLTGTLAGPKQVGEDSEGEFFGIFLPIKTRPLTGKAQDNAVEIVVGRKPDIDRTTIRLSDRNHLSISWFHGRVPDWTFTRVTDKQPVRVSADWPPYDEDPKIVTIRRQLKAMAEEDKAIRMKDPIDPDEVAALAAQDKPFLQSVFQEYGWPRISVFDLIACDNFWLLVQHQTATVQVQMLPALKKAVDEDEASKANYAYLFDRIETEEGKPQHWGTQAKCEGGRAVLYPIDDMSAVDERRKAAGLGPLAESIKSEDALCNRVRN